MDEQDNFNRGVTLGYCAAPDSMQAKLWSIGRAMHGSTCEKTINDNGVMESKASNVSLSAKRLQVETEMTRVTIEISVELLALISSQINQKVRKPYRY